MWITILEAIILSAIWFYAGKKYGELREKKKFEDYVDEVNARLELTLEDDNKIANMIIPNLPSYETIEPKEDEEIKFL